MRSQFNSALQNESIDRSSKKKKFSASIHKNNIPSIKIAYFAGFKIKKRNQNFIEFYKN